ncbi:hypothetical protein OLM02_03735 [Enterococcus faecalis]|uniref:hypothetical protein n=1 Tax=Enterococcus TaxID=1350 RepID=UPI0002FC2464|nr:MULTISPECIES: hypothetical protein [Enterococcus]MDN3201631.1 hypothetical protein [Enterococcus faecalis]MDQ8663209.1 hypothetical protein [Enterococcus sp. FR159]UYY45064.1 hypothetical protein OLM02_03735 [Enterococcus faecalis]
MLSTSSLFFSLLVVVGFTEHANAADFIPGKIVESEEFDDSERVVVLPDGAAISGGIFEIDDPNLFPEPVVIDTETSPLAITTNEYKKMVEAKPLINRADLVRRGSPAPTTAAGTYTVPNNGLYRSNYFSGRGWRFAGYNFRPASGTGAYLRWQTYNDSALVGTTRNARDTYNTGTGFGTIMTPGYSMYFTGPGNLTTYYSFNPAPNSYYIVRNW